MVQRPDIDLVAVSVRVPLHHELVMAGLRAGKPVFCEWPLGATLAEAEEMANLARERELSTFVGLQARSDPSIRYARDLVARGEIGEVLTANLSVITQAVTERGAGRSWQALRANGANPLTIPGGHSIDALCFVLGEVVEVAARVTTQITEWRDEDTGASIAVDAPDNIAVAGRLESGAEIAIQVATVPAQATGTPPGDLRSRGRVIPDRPVGEHRSGAAPRRQRRRLTRGARAARRVPARAGGDAAGTTSERRARVRTDRGRPRKRRSVRSRLRSGGATAPAAGGDRALLGDGHGGHGSRLVRVRVAPRPRFVHQARDLEGVGVIAPGEGVRGAEACIVRFLRAELGFRLDPFDRNLEPDDRLAHPVEVAVGLAGGRPRRLPARLVGGDDPGRP